MDRSSDVLKRLRELERNNATPKQIMRTCLAGRTEPCPGVLGVGPVHWYGNATICFTSIRKRLRSAGGLNNDLSNNGTGYFTRNRVYAKPLWRTGHGDQFFRGRSQTGAEAGRPTTASVNDLWYVQARAPPAGPPL